mmetsp:Transcript_165924/g.532679  ORF Transcript_165924/g.532679 Transcript_165924/m.532679 type:complete len:202 (-) Transcript_165924:26-631(-)
MIQREPPRHLLVPRQRHERNLQPTASSLPSHLCVAPEQWIVIQDSNAEVRFRVGHADIEALAPSGITLGLPLDRRHAKGLLLVDVQLDIGVQRGGDAQACRTEAHIHADQALRLEHAHSQLPEGSWWNLNSHRGRRCSTISRGFLEWLLLIYGRRRDRCIAYRILAGPELDIPRPATVHCLQPLLPAISRASGCVARGGGA